MQSFHSEVLNQNLDPNFILEDAFWLINIHTLEIYMLDLSAFILHI